MCTAGIEAPQGLEIEKKTLKNMGIKGDDVVKSASFKVS